MEHPEPHVSSSQSLPSHSMVQPAPQSVRWHEASSKQYMMQPPGHVVVVQVEPVAQSVRQDPLVHVVSQSEPSRHVE